MSAPLGSWNITGNGFQGILDINAVDGSGNLDASATVFGQTIIGFWDETSQKLTFIRVPADSSASSAYQIYTGYKMEGSLPDGATSALAGSFEAFGGTGGNASRSLFGWWATLTPVPPIG